MESGGWGIGFACNLCGGGNLRLSARDYVPQSNLCVVVHRHAFLLDLGATLLGWQHQGLGESGHALIWLDLSLQESLKELVAST